MQSSINLVDASVMLEIAEPRSSSDNSMDNLFVTNIVFPYGKMILTISSIFSPPFASRIRFLIFKSQRATLHSTQWNRFAFMKSRWKLFAVIRQFRNFKCSPIFCVRHSSFKNTRMKVKTQFVRWKMNGAIW